MEKTELEKDINAAKDLLVNGRKFMAYPWFGYYDQIYPFNNEHIKLYYDNLDYSLGTLCVASSGDHMLHAILKGTDKIVMFDINKLTSYYCNLKLAAVKSLSHKEFFDFFGKCCDLSPMLSRRDLFEKIKSSLKEEDKYFWEELYKVGLIESDKLFNLICTPMDNAYYDKDKYERLQENANKFEYPKFICCNVLNLPSHLKDEDVFSAMLLSNIQGYLKKEDNFPKLIYSDLNNHLAINGKIQYGPTIIKDKDIGHLSKYQGGTYIYTKRY